MRVPFLFKSASVLLGVDADNGNAAVDTVGDQTTGLFDGFVVNVAGSDPAPIIRVYMIDGSTLPVHAPQPGVPYLIPNRGIASVTAGMTEVYGLRAYT